MNRKNFLKSLLLTSTGIMLGTKINGMKFLTDSFEYSPKMPVLFLGHGSPMNAIEDNEFVQGFKNIASEITTPKAIVVVSAHWETKGTLITAMKNPPTIHDFGGFPQQLYNIEYNAPGNPELAADIKSMAKNSHIGLDQKWGLDHGAWTVIRHMYPKADIPLIQISLDYSKKAQQHYELAKEISKLRQKGVLVVGSGNIVHNLKMINWQKMNENFAFDWANEANNKMKQFISAENHKELIKYSSLGKEFELSIPTPEHYLPLLYILALQDNKDEIKIFNDEIVAGSVSMTSLKIG